MTAIDRRAFLRRAGLSTAALATLGGPLQGVFARGALHEGQITPVRLEELAVDGIYGQIAQGEIAWMTASSAASSAAPSRPTSSTETSR